MKILTFSKVCIVGAIILALFVAWAVTVPKPRTGECLHGGWPPCFTARPLTCFTSLWGRLEGISCEKEAVRCNHKDYGLTCSSIGPSDCSEWWDGCVNQDDEKCS